MNRIIQQIQNPSMQIGGTTGGGQAQNPPASEWDFALLIFAIILWFVGLYLFHESNQFILNQPTEDDRRSLAPYSGALLSWVLSPVVILIWGFRSLLVLDVQLTPQNVISFALFDPVLFAPGFLLAALLPTTVGIVKFSYAIAMQSSQRTSAEVSAKKSLVAFVYTFFAILNAVASLVTLFKLIK